MDETYLVPVLITGVAVVALGLIWFLVAAFRQHVLWGLACFPLVVGAPFFTLRHWPRARRPVALILIGAIVVTTPFVLNRIAQHFLDLGPREKMVDGELHITLNGWDRTDYSVLRARPGVVVLQMANPDVTDATLDDLDGMTKLRELDLDNTKITDAGLAKLAKISTLRNLRLGHTAITDEGFREYLMPLDNLLMVNLTGTKVTGPTAREWRAAKPDRRVLR